MKKILFSVVAFLFTMNVEAQEAYRLPLDIPAVLSANFGELRPNHFHSGIDFKTQGVINKKVYSVADGYISRISVSPSGYGLALYITHPKTNQISVYGHLEGFSPAVNEYVRKKQNELEAYKVDLALDADVFFVSKGDFIAYSGNTGSSGGPHVHFEIRDVQSQRALDVIPFYKKNIKDTKAPVVRGIAVYPQEGEGVLNGSYDIFRQSIAKGKDGSYGKINRKLSAWGRIGFGVYANDYMDNTANIYGVRSIKLFCDDLLVYSNIIESVDFDQTRMINSMTDYHHWYKHKEFYVKSFVEPGNKLDCIKAVNEGYITVDQEKIYNLRYELEDVHGNKTTYRFAIEGKKQVYPNTPKCGLYMDWIKNNYYLNADFNLTVPALALYDNVCFRLKKEKSDIYYSNLFEVNDKYVPLAKKSVVGIKVTVDTIQNKKQYGLVAVDGKRPVWLGGVYRDGFISAEIDKLGQTYAVAVDDKAPIITPIAPEKWKVSKVIKLKLTDNLSGIASYRGTINGKFALFEHDVKSPTYIYKFDPERLSKGVNILEFRVVDAAGNSSVYTWKFNY